MPTDPSSAPLREDYASWRETAERWPADQPCPLYFRNYVITLADVVHALTARLAAVEAQLREPLVIHFDTRHFHRLNQPCGVCAR